MATAKIRATRVYEETYNALSQPYRFIVNQGGTRSSKTYSIAQVIATLMLQEQGKVFTVVRKTLPALKFTAMKDFFEIIKDMELYSEEYHNKTELIYRYNNNEVEFLAVDQPQKIRGRKREYLWMNEANELSYEDYQQLNLRTTGKVFLDYNPSDEFHWIYEQVITRKDAKFIQSTYKDNPFLDRETVMEIERLKELDENYWRIYGLGERGVSQTTIYTHWQYCDTLPEGDMFYGLDFGYNNPSALTRVVLKDDDIYTEELIYESHLTNQDLIERVKSIVKSGSVIYCDSAEPNRIEELRRAGLNARASEKSVADGIDSIKRRKLYITKGSVNMLKEIKAYRWREKNEETIDEPVKTNDHLMDALRYAVYSHTNQKMPGIFVG